MRKMEEDMQCEVPASRLASKPHWNVAAGFLSGTLFGVGLALSGMIYPKKVLGFLDLAGAWDPSLALVMGGALVITALGYPLVLKCDAPLLAPKFALPTLSQIDVRLVVGSALFGMGWGLAGLCPGPALGVLPFAGIDFAARDWFFFFIPMLTSVYIMRRYFAPRT